MFKRLGIITLILTFLSLSSKNLKANEKITECAEGFSRAMFSFNMGLDKVIIKPIAQLYSFLPVGVRESINNALLNIESTVSFPNQILQGNFNDAGLTLGRFLINSTVGIAGIFDPASALGLAKPNREDFGQTFGTWGVGQGCYIVLPVLGPTTPRDGVGRVLGIFGDYFYMVTVGDTKFLGKSVEEHWYWYEVSTDLVNFRAQNIKSFENLEKNSLDLYAAVKSLYLQKRENLVRNAKSSDGLYGGKEDDWKDIK